MGHAQQQPRVRPVQQRESGRAGGGVRGAVSAVSARRHEVEVVHRALERQRHGPRPGGAARLQVVPHLVAVAEGPREHRRAVQRAGGREEVADRPPPEEVLREVPPDSLRAGAADGVGWPGCIHVNPAACIPPPERRGSLGGGAPSATPGRCSPRGPEGSSTPRQRR